MRSPVFLLSMLLASVLLAPPTPAAGLFPTPAALSPQSFFSVLLKITLR